MPLTENKDIGSWDMSLNEGNEGNVQWTLHLVWFVWNIYYELGNSFDDTPGVTLSPGIPSPLPPERTWYHRYPTSLEGTWDQDLEGTWNQRYPTPPTPHEQNDWQIPLKLLWCGKQVWTCRAEPCAVRFKLTKFEHVRVGVWRVCV